MFKQVLTSALFAGFAAGLIAAALQLVFVQPVLLAAELYESGEMTHFDGSGSAPVMAMQFSPVRDLLSIMFSALIYVGYAMLLVSLMALATLRDVAITPRSGVVWGLAGFVALHLAPAFGLPPELPGSAAVDVGVRQVWWVSTVVATGVGLWLIAFGNGLIWLGLGIIAILAPQIVGAPHPETLSGPVPPELAALFSARALAVGLAAWVALGTFAAIVWLRESSD
ncbi:MAG: CbtA family protein [Pseudooceanicola sp.]